MPTTATNAGFLPGMDAPPGCAQYIAPPRWTNYQLVLATTSAIVVPQNVYQVKVLVWGKGSAGNAGVSSGAGGGFAQAILDVIPGQLLPTITIGTNCSYGTALSATGASGTTGGTGTVDAAQVRPGSGFTAAGGSGGYINAGGAASGSPFGAGGNASGSTSTFGGSAWGGVVATTGAAYGATSLVSGGNAVDSFLAVANGQALPGMGGISATAPVGIGCGGFGVTNAAATPPGFGGGGGSDAGSGTVAQNGALGGGGGGGSPSGTAGTGGPGCVLIAWTPGY